MGQPPENMKPKRIILFFSFLNKSINQRGTHMQMGTVLKEKEEMNIKIKIRMVVLFCHNLQIQTTIYY